MNEKQQLLQTQLNAFGKFLSLVIMILLCGPAVFAQDDRQMDSRDPMVIYIQSHQDSPFVKYLSANPDDGDAMRMVKTVMIVENPDQFPDFSTEDIDRLKSDLEGFTKKVNYVNELVENGDTYEMAKIRYDRNDAVASPKVYEMPDKNTNADTPSISVPAAPQK